MAMTEKTFASHIDHMQNIWFKGKDIAKILGYCNTNLTISKQVSEKYKKKQGYRIHTPLKWGHIYFRTWVLWIGFQVQTTNC